MNPITRHLVRLGVTVMPSLAILGEVHQRLLGYPFNYYQLFDGRIHHEHLILACFAGFLVSLIKLRRN